MDVKIEARVGLFAIKSIFLPTVPTDDDNQLSKYNDYVVVFVALQNTISANQKWILYFFEWTKENQNLYRVLVLKEWYNVMLWLHIIGTKKWMFQESYL